MMLNYYERTYCAGERKGMALVDEFNMFFSTLSALFTPPGTTLVNGSRHGWSLFGAETTIEAAASEWFKAWLESYWC